MGKIALEDSQKFSSNSRGFFILKDDKDVASVRFMYENEEDLDIFVVHRVTVNGQDRYVNCLRDDPNSPESDCPLCAAGHARMVRMFLQVAEVTKFNDKTKEDIAWDAKIWDRGPQFSKKIQGIVSRYNPLCGTLFEIERQGKKGDQKTEYGIFPITTDGLKLTELPERKEILGTLVLDKSYEDLDAFVLTGQFPQEDDEQPVRRRGSSDDSSSPRMENPRGRVSGRSEQVDEGDDEPFKQEGTSESAVSSRRRSEDSANQEQRTPRRRV